MHHNNRVLVDALAVQRTIQVVDEMQSCNWTKENCTDEASTTKRYETLIAASTLFNGQQSILLNCIANHSGVNVFKNVAEGIVVYEL